MRKHVGALCIAVAILFSLTGCERMYRVTGNTIYPESLCSLDTFNSSKVLYFALLPSGKLRYRIAIRTQATKLDSHPRTESWIPWHKRIYPHQVWLDGAIWPHRSSPLMQI